MNKEAVPTIQAVALRAGVSIGTVSNVLNRPSQVRPETRARVLQAIDQLGYIRNAAARDLKRRRTEGIGLIVPDIVNRLFVEMARGAQITAQSRGLSLLMANAVFQFESFDAPDAQTDRQDQFLDDFAEARVSGILLASMRDPAEGIARIRGHVSPIVVLNYDQPGDWCSVLMDNEEAGRLAAEHVAEIGIRHILFLSTADVAQPIIERRRGLHDGAQRLGLEVTDVSTDGLWVEDGIKATTRLLSHEPIDGRYAIVGVTDEIAIGALQTLRAHPGIRVPHDVAVMGLDGDHDGEHSDWITLTSIVLPAFQMGEEAIRLVIDEAEPGHQHQRSVLPVTIRGGQSTTG
ncbi:LacI family DNA-binding transcriptional regulator [Leifsonia sp. NPDC058248]|uniref:LacI family DNA-binding transcriptional regulator n=1 Tax=Leifsonia sp. NPDC058248 TaxID=3346402 RepID=UPI0036D8F08C